MTKTVVNKKRLQDMICYALYNRGDIDARI